MNTMHANLIPVEWPKVTALPYQLASHKGESGNVTFMFFVALICAAGLILYVWAKNQGDVTKELLNKKNRITNAIS